MIRRRSLLAAGLAAGTAPLAAPAVAQRLRRITFLTSWAPEGSNFYAWIARERGFWRARGLDVEVLRGSGSGMAVQSVATAPDRFQFGMGSSSVIVLQAAKGLRLACLGMVNYDATMGVGVRASGPIRNVRDLAGTRWAITPTSGEVPFLPLFAQKAGFAYDSVRIQQVAGNVRESLLLRGEVDAVSASASTALAALVPQGFDMRFFLFRSVGVKFYGQTVITQPQRLAEDPGLCEAVADGALEAVKYTLTNPEDTLAEMARLHSDLALSATGRQSMAVSFGVAQAVTVVPELMQHGIGHADHKALQESIDLIMQYAAAPGDRAPVAEELQTNRFAGRHRITEAQAEAVRRWATPYTTALV